MISEYIERVIVSGEKRKEIIDEAFANHKPYRSKIQENKSYQTNLF